MPKISDEPMINTSVNVRLSIRTVLLQAASESGQNFSEVVRQACDEFALRWLEAQRDKASA